MGFKFKSLRLPFVRITTRTVTQLRVAGQPVSKRPVTTTHTWAWHVGPWQYNSRTGAHTLTLGKRVKYVTKTRSQKATAAKAKAKQRVAERAAWDKQIAASNGRPDPATTKPASTRPHTKGRPASTTVVHGTGRALHPGEQLKGDPTCEGRPRCPGCNYPMKTTDRGTFRCPNYCGNEVDPVPSAAPTDGVMSLAERTEKLRAAGLCGAPTKDRSPCLNHGQCPHHSKGGGS